MSDGYVWHKRVAHVRGGVVRYYTLRILDWTVNVQKIGSVWRWEVYAMGITTMLAGVKKVVVSAYGGPSLGDAVPDALKDEILTNSRIPKIYIPLAERFNRARHEGQQRVASADSNVPSMTHGLHLVAVGEHKYLNGAKWKSLQDVMDLVNAYLAGVTSCCTEQGLKVMGDKRQTHYQHRR